MMNINSMHCSRVQSIHQHVNVLHPQLKCLQKLEEGGLENNTGKLCYVQFWGWNQQFKKKLRGFFSTQVLFGLSISKHHE